MENPKHRVFCENIVFFQVPAISRVLEASGIYITISDTSIVIPISPMDPAVPSQERLGSIGIGLRNMVLRLVGTCIDSPDVFAIKDS